jgi:hypothetical protein
MLEGIDPQSREKQNLPPKKDSGLNGWGSSSSTLTGTDLRGCESALVRGTTGGNSHAASLPAIAYFPRWIWI